MLRLALPSDGELHEPSLQFFRSCGIGVRRASLRRYTAEIPSLPEVAILFQRSADITSKVDEGSADMGIVGLDRFLEFHREAGDSLLVMENLGFGHCELVIGAPDSWVDVTSTADLADLGAEFRAQGREFRVVTKYPRLVQRFLFSKGVNYFTLVQASGTLEAAPAMGYADIIADISATGATLRENRLKTLMDGTILSSEACLIGNKALLGREPAKLQQAKAILERIEGHLRAQEYYRITANVRGSSPEMVASSLRQRRQLAGLQGPTISPVYSTGEENWCAVTVVVHKEELLEAVDHLRQVGAGSATVFQPSYVFQSECQAYTRLLEALRKESLAQL